MKMQGEIYFCNDGLSQRRVRATLEEMGVQVGAYDSNMMGFKDCVVPDEAVFQRLDPLWGPLVWALSEAA